MMNDHKGRQSGIWLVLAAAVLWGTTGTAQALRVLAERVADERRKECARIVAWLRQRAAEHRLDGGINEHYREALGIASDDLEREAAEADVALRADPEE